MENLITQFPSQLKDAINIQSKFEIFEDDFNPQNIVISGMGGSAIGGGIVKDYLYPIVNIPIYVNRHYFLPAYVNENSLVIICSYSGNTEETISALQDAILKNAKIICFSAGGKLEELAKEKNIPHLALPKDYHPRATIGYAIAYILHIISEFKIIGKSYITEIQESISLLEKEMDYIKEHSRQLAEDLLGKTPIFYSSNNIEDITTRWRQQINENAKTIAWDNVLPEMNHNEIVGWDEKKEDFAVVFLRNDNDFGRIKQRIDLSIEIIKKCTDAVFEIHSKGNNFFERAFYLIHYGDWLSIHLAALKGIDPGPVAPIEFIKSNLK